MKYKEHILVILIGILTVAFYVGNFSKLEYLHKKFLQPAFNNTYTKDSNIVRVRIESPIYSTRKSFVKDTLVNPMGKYIMFMQVPLETDLGAISDSIYIEGQKTQGLSIDTNILLASNQSDSIRVYLINDMYKQNMATILKMEGLLNIN